MSKVLGLLLAVLVGGFGLLGSTHDADARLFCYNRYTGRFLHWGACGRSHPRVYCYNRYTGRFLHWGHC